MASKSLADLRREISVFLGDKNLKYYQGMIWNPIDKNLTKILKIRFNFMHIQLYK